MRFKNPETPTIRTIGPQYALVIFDAKYPKTNLSILLRKTTFLFLILFSIFLPLLYIIIFKKNSAILQVTFIATPKDSHFLTHPL